MELTIGQRLVMTVEWRRHPSPRPSDADSERLWRQVELQRLLADEARQREYDKQTTLGGWYGLYSTER